MSKQNQKVPRGGKHKINDSTKSASLVCPKPAKPHPTK